MVSSINYRRYYSWLTSPWVPMLLLIQKYIKIVFAQWLPTQSMHHSENINIEYITMQKKDEYAWLFLYPLRVKSEVSYKLNYAYQALVVTNPDVWVNFIGQHFGMMQQYEKKKTKKKKKKKKKKKSLSGLRTRTLSYLCSCAYLPYKTTFE